MQGFHETAFHTCFSDNLPLTFCSFFLRQFVRQFSIRATEKLSYFSDPKVSYTTEKVSLKKGLVGNSYKNIAQLHTSQSAGLLLCKVSTGANLAVLSIWQVLFFCSCFCFAFWSPILTFWLSLYRFDFLVLHAECLGILFVLALHADCLFFWLIMLLFWPICLFNVPLWSSTLTFCFLWEFKVIVWLVILLFGCLIVLVWLFPKEVRFFIVVFWFCVLQFWISRSFFAYVGTTFGCVCYGFAF